MRLYGVRIKIVGRSRGNIGRVVSYKFTTDGDVRLLVRIGVKLVCVWKDDVELLPEDVAENESLHYTEDRRVP